LGCTLRTKTRHFANKASAFEILRPSPRIPHDVKPGLGESVDHCTSVWCGGLTPFYLFVRKVSNMGGAGMTNSGAEVPLNGKSQGGATPPRKASRRDAPGYKPRREEFGCNINRDLSLAELQPAS